MKSKTHVCFLPSLSFLSFCYASCITYEPIYIDAFSLVISFLTGFGLVVTCSFREMGPYVYPLLMRLKTILIDSSSLVSFDSSIT